MWKWISKKQLVNDLAALTKQVKQLEGSIDHVERISVLKKIYWVNRFNSPTAREKLAKDGYAFSHNFAGSEVWVKSPETPKAVAKKPKAKVKSSKKGR